MSATTTLTEAPTSPVILAVPLMVWLCVRVATVGQGQVPRGRTGRIAYTSRPGQRAVTTLVRVGIAPLLGSNQATVAPVKAAKFFQWLCPSADRYRESPKASPARLPYGADPLDGGGF